MYMIELEIRPYYIQQWYNEENWVDYFYLERYEVEIDYFPDETIINIRYLDPSE